MIVTGTTIEQILQFLNNNSNSLFIKSLSIATFNWSPKFANHIDRFAKIEVLNKDTEPTISLVPELEIVNGL